MNFEDELIVAFVQGAHRHLKVEKLKLRVNLDDFFITVNLTRVEMYQIGAGEFVVKCQAVADTFQGA